MYEEEGVKGAEPNLCEAKLQKPNCRAKWGNQRTRLRGGSAHPLDPPHGAVRRFVRLKCLRCARMPRDRAVGADSKHRPGPYPPPWNHTERRERIAAWFKAVVQSRGSPGNHAGSPKHAGQLAL